MGPGADRMLAADGPMLRDEAGRTVVLQGTNLGGWLMHEGWISPCGAPSLDRAGWSAWSATSAPGRTPAMAIDSDETTAWESGAGPLDARCLVVDMGDVRAFDRVSMVAPRTVRGAERIEVDVSPDGREWRTIGSVAPADGRCWIAPGRQDARYVRVAGSGWPGSTHAGASVVVNDLKVHMADESNLRRVLEGRFGRNGAARLLAVHQATWISADDLDHVVDLGLNLVRVPFAWQVLMHDDGTMRDDASAFGTLDWLVEEAARRGLYVVLDLHGAPGGANPADFGGEAGSNRLWTDPEAQRRTETIWRGIAARYRGHPTVAGYDLLNEPVVGDGAAEDEEQIRQKYALIDRLYQAVREVDPHHVVFIPAFPSLARTPAPDVHGWTNVVYESHHFGFEAHADAAGQARFVEASLSELSAAQRSWNIPLFVGEFWLSSFTHLFGEFTRGLNERGISWANWTYKHKNPADARFPHGLDQGPNWGFFYDGPDAEPDLDHDDASTLEAKWRRYGTSAFRANRELARVIGAETGP